MNAGPTQPPVPSETATPRSDAAILKSYSERSLVPWDFARQLERELTAAQARLKLFESEGMGDWTLERMADLYYEQGACGLIDFVVNHMLQAFNERLGGHSWVPYESDGSIEEALDYEVTSLLVKAGVLSDEDHSVTHLSFEADLLAAAREKEDAQRACAALREAWKNLSGEMFAHIPLQYVEGNSVQAAIAEVQRAMKSETGKGYRSPAEVAVLVADITTRDETIVHLSEQVTMDGKHIAELQREVEAAIAARNHNRICVERLTLERDTALQQARDAEARREKLARELEQDAGWFDELALLTWPDGEWTSATFTDRSVEIEEALAQSAPVAESGVEKDEFTHCTECLSTSGCKNLGYCMRLKALSLQGPPTTVSLQTHQSHE